LLDDKDTSETKRFPSHEPVKDFVSLSQWHAMSVQLFG